MIANRPFGTGVFNITDVWTTNNNVEVLTVRIGPDERQKYLSFNLSDEQRAALGSTTCTHLRIAVQKVNMEPETNESRDA